MTAVERRARRDAGKARAVLTPDECALIAAEARFIKNKSLSAKARIIIRRCESGDWKHDERQVGDTIVRRDGQPLSVRFVADVIRREQRRS